MAKKNDTFSYSALLNELKKNGPQRLYYLCGEEDYLREQFIIKLRSVCLPEGENDFSFRRLDGGSLNVRELTEAVNALPFLTERSFCEVRGIELGKIREADADEFVRTVSDIPDYCTLVLVPPYGTEADWRLKTAKTVKKLGTVVSFTAQSEGQLMPWIRRRFAALGKDVTPEAVRRLIYTGGELMNGLIPEIEKIASGVRGDTVTERDVDALAHRIPEAKVFDLTDCLASRDFDGGARLLSDLLSSGDEPVAILAMIGMQFRRLYAARLAIDRRLGKSYVAEVCGVKYDFIIDKLMTAARGFTLPKLAECVRLCADTDYAMKSSGESGAALLCELLVRVAV